MPACLWNRRVFAGTVFAGAITATASCGRQTPQQEAPRDQTTVLSKDGTRIAFNRAGEGPALILVGGALSDRSGSTPLAERLASRFTVFTYDRRGRGDSGDTAPYATEREVEDIEALIDQAGGTAFVHGHSSGAVLSLEAANRQPTRITKLSLYEPPLITDSSRPAPPQDWVAQVNTLVAAGRRGDAVALFMTEVVGTPASAIAEMRSAPSWAALEALAHTIAYDGAILGDTMSGRPLPTGRWTSPAPTLVMDGGASPQWIRNSAQMLARILPNAQHRSLEGQTHQVAPDVLAPALQEFFA